MTTTDTRENKAVVQLALAELIAHGDVDALGRRLTDGFVHHKPDGTSSTKPQWLAEVGTALAAVPFADLQVEVLHMLADGDHVVLYTRRRLPGSDSGIAVVDILRLDGGLIAEAWEIIEREDQVAANLAWWKPVEG